MFPENSENKNIIKLENFAECRSTTNSVILVVYRRVEKAFKFKLYAKVKDSRIAYFLELSAVQKNRRKTILSSKSSNCDDRQKIDKMAPWNCG